MRLSPRSAAILLAGALAGCAQMAAPDARVPGAETPARLDIDVLCSEIRDRYVYFDARAGHWDAACANAAGQAETADTLVAQIAVVERLLDDLYDPHINLGTNTRASPRLVPSGSDLWFENAGGQFVVAAVRPGSGAARAGVALGDALVRFNGLSPEALWQSRIHTPSNPLPAARTSWALNAAIAGRYDAPRRLEVRRGGAVLAFDLADPMPAQAASPVTADILPGRIGYIRFNNSLGADETVAAFDDALETLRGTAGLILDLRDTPSGGNTGVAEPILGRLVAALAPYQVAVYPGGREAQAQITPRGPWTYGAPIIALCGRWTGSMGEGMVIGLDGTRRAKVMGSAMAGLAGGTEPLVLPQSGLTVWLPTYDLRHLDGTPRHQWMPGAGAEPGDFRADFGDGRDMLLARARRALAGHESRAEP
ncbi:MAG: S41 family peptidase [Pseudomonadota bacterium]